MICNIEIYTKKNCPYCNKAKDFFFLRLLKFKEILIDEDLLGIDYMEMRRRSQGRVTVPQIFINDYHIGGWDDLVQMNDNDPDKLNILLCRV